MMNLITMKYYNYKNNEDRFVRIPGTYNEQDKTIQVDFRTTPILEPKTIKYAEYKENKDKYELIEGTYNKAAKTVVVLKKINDNLLFGDNYEIVWYKKIDDMKLYFRDTGKDNMFGEDRPHWYNALIKNNRTGLYYLMNLDNNKNVIFTLYNETEYEEEDWKGGYMQEITVEGITHTKPINEITKEDFEMLTHTRNEPVMKCHYEALSIEGIKKEAIEELKDIIECQKEYILKFNRPGVFTNIKDYQEYYNHICECIRAIDKIMNTKTDAINNRLSDWFIIVDEPVKTKINLSKIC